MERKISQNEVPVTELRTVFFLFSLLCALLMLLPAAVCGRTGEANPTEVACYGTDPADKQTGGAVTEAGSADGTSEKASSAEGACAEEPVITDETELTSDTAEPTYTLTLETAAGKKELAPEDYVRGILMGEMLSSFDTEAWKALAVAARTYVLYRIEHGLPLSDDAGVCCAYLSDEDAEKRFGEAFSAVYEKAKRAVDATVGEILLYDGAPACTMFHAMSYEKTASAEAVFGNAVPYLVSVSTPEALTISGMVTTAVFDRDTVNRLLGVTDGLPLTVTYGSDGRADTVATATGQSFTGTAFRSRLSLRSCAFYIAEQNPDSVTFVVRGSGHGVGMSQWGAAVMAAGGSDYRAILAHYYPGTEAAALYGIRTECLNR